MSQLDGKQIKDLSIATAKLASNAVTAAKVGSDVIVAAGTNAFSADQSMGTHKITNLGAPSAANDAARLADVTAASQGFSVKAAVRLVATTALASCTFAAAGPDTLTSTTNNAFPAVDGFSLALNESIAVAGQATGSNNGLYTLTQQGTGAVPWILTRRNDYDIAAEVHQGDLFLVEEGTANGGSQFTQTATAPTLNTTALVYAKLGSATTFATPTVAADAAAATGGAASTAISSDAKLQVSTAVPSVTVKSEATAAAVGTATSLLRSDMQIQAATATPSNLGTALGQGTSSSLARADHIHAGPKPALGNKDMTASVTTADNQVACATTLVAAPILGGYIGVRVNGQHIRVGDGSKTSPVEAYFSVDGGTTPRAMSAITAGDTLYWNQSIAGYNLAATDRIDFDHETF